MKTILTYRFSAFGDIAMTVPVICEFLNQNEDIRIVMVSRENFSELFMNVHTRLVFVGVNLSNYKGIKGVFRLGKILLKDHKPDFIADLHDVLRTKILYFYFKIKGFKVFKIDKGRKDKKNLSNVWNINKFQLKKTTERYADVFRSMGFGLKLSHKLKSFLKQHSDKEKQGIGFAPFAKHKGKMMPLEKSFELAKNIAKREHVYFFGGGPIEVKLLEKWADEIPNSTSLAGKLNLKEELENISRLRLMISMDSANMHLASLAGVRVISVWGATHYYAGFLGYGQSEEDIIHVKDLTCRPCSIFGNKKCFRDDWACLEELNIQYIIDKIHG